MKQTKRAVLYNRISSEPIDLVIHVPNKKGKRLRGEWYTPKELGFEIVETKLATIRRLRKQHRKGVAK